MIQRLLGIVLAVALVGVVGGCEKPPVSTNKDMPIKGSGGVDAKGKKSRTVDATLEAPPPK